MAVLEHGIKGTGTGNFFTKLVPDRLKSALNLAPIRVNPVQPVERAVDQPVHDDTQIFEHLQLTGDEETDQMLLFLDHKVDAPASNTAYAIANEAEKVEMSDELKARFRLAHELHGIGKRISDSFSSEAGKAVNRQAGLSEGPLWTELQIRALLQEMTSRTKARSGQQSHPDHGVRISYFTPGERPTYVNEALNAAGVELDQIFPQNVGDGNVQPGRLIAEVADQPSKRGLILFIESGSSSVYVSELLIQRQSENLDISLQKETVPSVEGIAQAVANFIL